MSTAGYSTTAMGSLFGTRPAAKVVGILTLNADEDYRRADRILRKHTPMAS